MERTSAVPAAVVLLKIAAIVNADAHPLPYPYRNIRQKAVVHQNDYKLEVMNQMSSFPSEMEYKGTNTGGVLCLGVLNIVPYAVVSYWSRSCGEGCRFARYKSISWVASNGRRNTWWSSYVDRCVITSGVSFSGIKSKPLVATQV